MRVYYNEFDKKKCSALQQLMNDGHINKGDIDDRSITDVRADDVRGYDRCHFFAGIGLWDYSLQLAGWGDCPVWTGSCPCQPFSVAGRQEGKADDRHLWPEWLRLIRECELTTIFGEQVASAVNKGWLDEVYEGLEAQDYSIGSVVLPACSVGAPHRRDRLWFVATNNLSERVQGCREEEVSRQSGFSWCKDVRGVKDLRNRPNLPQPLLRSLDDGNTENVGILHSVGDGIVPQVAAEFIQAFISFTGRHD